MHFGHSVVLRKMEIESAKAAHPNVSFRKRATDYMALFMRIQKRTLSVDMTRMCVRDKV